MQVDAAEELGDTTNQAFDTGNAAQAFQLAAAQLVA